MKTTRLFLTGGDLIVNDNHTIRKILPNPIKKPRELALVSASLPTMGEEMYYRTDQTFTIFFETGGDSYMKAFTLPKGVYRDIRHCITVINQIMLNNMFYREKSVTDDSKEVKYKFAFREITDSDSDYTDFGVYKFHFILEFENISHNNDLKGTEKNFGIMIKDGDNFLLNLGFDIYSDGYYYTWENTNPPKLGENKGSARQKTSLPTPYNVEIANVYTEDETADGVDVYGQGFEALEFDNKIGIVGGKELMTFAGSIDNVFLLVNYPLMRPSETVSSSSLTICNSPILGRIPLTNSGTEDSKYIPTSAIQNYSLTISQCNIQLDIMEFVFIGYSYITKDYEFIDFKEKEKISIQLNVTSVI